MKTLTAPIRRRRPGLIGVQFMGDLFHEHVPINFIAEVFDVMASWRLKCRIKDELHEHDGDCWEPPGHTFLILTKRPERMYSAITREIEEHIANYWPGDTALGVAMEFRGWPLANAWLGVNLEDQATADERIPWLLNTPAALRFVSYEPALGPIDFGQWVFPKWVIDGYDEVIARYPRPWTPPSLGRPVRLDWVIAGGETGPGARPAHPDWFRAVRDQCQATGTPFFFKHWGEWLPAGQGGEGSGPMPNCRYEEFDHCVFARVGHKRAGRRLDGREWNEMPEMPHTCGEGKP